LGNFKAANNHFEEGLRISRRLAEADPANDQAQVDLAYSFAGLAKCEIAAKNHAVAKERLVQSISLMEKLEATGQLKHQPRWQVLLDENRDLLAECERQLANRND
jgi:hypothetical protein